VLLHGEAYPTGFYKAVYPSYFIYKTYVDPETGELLYAEHLLKFPKYTDYKQWKFDNETGKVVRYRKKTYNRKGKPDKEYRGEIQYDRGTPDEFLSLMLLRIQPCPLDTEYRYQMFTSTRQVTIGIRQMDDSEVKVKAGTFDCRIIEPVYYGSETSFSKQTRMQLFIDKGEHNLFVKAKVKLWLGSATAVLENYTPAVDMSKREPILGEKVEVAQAAHAYSKEPQTALITAVSQGNTAR
jgi:hypothetical protein